MKRALLRNEPRLSEQGMVLVRLFEESLSKKLDEIFKQESPNLYNDLSRGLKKAICHLCPDNGDGKDKD